MAASLPQHLSGVKNLLSDATVDISIARTEGNLIKAPDELIRTANDSLRQSRAKNKLISIDDEDGLSSSAI